MGNTNDNLTLLPQLRMLMSINRNQKEYIRKSVKEHPNWDELLRHDLLHHCLVQENLPIKSDIDNSDTYHMKMIEFRRRLDEQNRLAGCCISLIEKLDRQNKNK